jgi:excisionase family DNA binding protein
MTLQTLPEDAMPSDDAVLTPSEAAAVLFVSQQHVLALLDSGKLALASEPGKPPLVHQSVVQRYKAQQRQAASAFLHTQTEDSDPPGL